MRRLFSGEVGIDYHQICVQDAAGERPTLEASFAGQSNGHSFTRELPVPSTPASTAQQRAEDIRKTQGEKLREKRRRDQEERRREQRA